MENDRMPPVLRPALLLVLYFALRSVGVAEEARVFAPKLQPFVDKGILAGAVMLTADRNRICHLEAVGYADLERKRVMRTDDLFWIASITKTITGAAFLMLVDEGKVSLDDPVERFIPAFSSVRVRKADCSLVPPVHPITVREILSHTSGMGFLNKTDAQIIDSVPLRTSIEHNLLEPLQHEPGETYLYSNQGIDTAGLIMEIVSGLPYETFLQERLFTPLGMVDTTFRPTAAQLERLAVSYRVKDDKTGLEAVPIRYLTYPLDGKERYPAPGGGLFSTARDVGRFGQMLLNEGTFEGRTYLSKEAMKTFRTKQTPPSVPTQYSLGVNVAPEGDYLGHGGAYKTDLRVRGDEVRVFLVQQASGWAEGDPGLTFQQAAAALITP
jgi:CubicO group peptidase (beta-lactamase class C family)